MQVVSIFLLIIGFLVMVAGAVQLTQATVGVGLVGIACFFAIVARLAQAATSPAAAAPRAVVADSRRVARRLLPPPTGEWPPRTGEKLRVAHDLELATEPDGNAPAVGILTAGTQFVVVRTERDWLYAQSADSGIEGWIQV